jgi:hypothetical protein
LQKHGAELEAISLPTIKEAIEAGNRIAMAEATAYHQSAGYFPARSAEYGHDVSARLAAGAEIHAVDFLAAQQAVRRSRSEFAAVFNTVDAIVTPTTPMPATPIGAERMALGDSDAYRCRARWFGRQRRIGARRFSRLQPPGKPHRFARHFRLLWIHRCWLACWPAVHRPPVRRSHTALNRSSL